MAGGAGYLRPVGIAPAGELEDDAAADLMQRVMLMTIEKLRAGELRDGEHRRVLGEYTFNHGAHAA